MGYAVFFTSYSTGLDAMVSTYGGSAVTPTIAGRRRKALKTIAQYAVQRRAGVWSGASTGTNRRLISI